MQLDSTRIAIVQTTDDCPGSLLVLMLLALLKDEDEDEVEMRWRWMNTAPVPENALNRAHSPQLEHESTHWSSASKDGRERARSHLVAQSTTTGTK